MQDSLNTEIIYVIIIGVMIFLAIAIGTVFMYARLYYKSITQKLIFETKLQIREQTFNMISEEIHDNIGQMLSLARVQLAMVENTVGRGLEQVEQLKDTLLTVSTELRQMARGLSGEIVKAFTVIELVNNLAARINECKTTHIEVKITGEQRLLPDREKFIIFRIIQEVLQNCLKHACAKRITIEFQFSKDNLSIYIEDDGNGFEINVKQQQPVGLGLQHIRERMKFIGGNAGISSQPSFGTRILLQLPLQAS